MEEQQNEESGKYFHVENVAKNIVTTTIGILLMIVSAGTEVVSWFIALPLIKEWHLAAVFGGGFMLLFMRDKISTYIDIFTRKKIG